MNKTSIIILTYNNLLKTKECIESIRKYTNKKTYEIIVIDNNSTDNTKDWLKKQKDLKVIYNKKNLGFPKGCNIALNVANKNNDILLLNNDTIVTNNWLDNLKKCLYSSLDIGAVGPVCNQNENQQGCDLKFQNVIQMQQEAFKNNISDKNRWEEKVFLIGYCLLIRRDVINKIKFLDENYSPGYIEDNDLSLQIIKLGYRLFLCHDTFIYHYLGASFRQDLSQFYPILNKNRNYFYRKWHFETSEFDRLKNASHVFLKPYQSILDYQCGIGNLILYLKYRYNVKIDGVEKNINKRFFSQKFGKVYKNIDEAMNYDCILIGDVLEKVNNPLYFLRKIKKHLNPNGVLIGEINNFSSVHVINYLLNDQGYDLFNKQKNLFTLIDLIKILKKLNFKNVEIYSWYDEKSNYEKKLIDDFKLEHLKYSYYTFKALN